MRTITKSTRYKDYPLSLAKNNNGHYVEILDSINSLLTYMTHKHKNVYVVNFIVKYPMGSNLFNDNTVFIKFIEAFSCHCRRKNYDPKYLWVRERSERTGQYHYHVIYTFNSNIIQNAHGITQKAIQLWAGCLNIQNADGLVYLCTIDNEHNNYGGVKLRQSDPNFHQVISTVFQRASYLAKVYSKDHLIPYLNRFRMSWLN